jgi:hypothetical protein
VTAVDMLRRVDEPAGSVDAVTGAAIRQVAAAGHDRFTVLGITNKAFLAEVARRLRRRVLGHLRQLDDLATARGHLLAGRRAAGL